MADPAEEFYRILLVEDDEDDHELVLHLLGQALGDRYDLRWAGDGMEALQMIGLYEFDILLMDYMLGLHTGLDVIRRVQRVRPSLPVIMISGVTLGSQTLAEESARSGVSYISKNNLTGGQLLDAIRAAIRSQHADFARSQSPLHDGVT